MSAGSLGEVIAKLQTERHNLEDSDEQLQAIEPDEIRHAVMVAAETAAQLRDQVANIMRLTNAALGPCVEARTIHTEASQQLTHTILGYRNDTPGGTDIRAALDEGERQLPAVLDQIMELADEIGDVYPLAENINNRLHQQLLGAVALNGAVGEARENNDITRQLVEQLEQSY